MEKFKLTNNFVYSRLEAKTDKVSSEDLSRLRYTVCINVVYR